MWTTTAATALLFILTTAHNTQARKVCESCKFVDRPIGNKEILPYGIQMVVGPGGNGPGPTSLLKTDILVCVLDTGIYTAHPDLKGNKFSGCDAHADSKYCKKHPYNKPTDLHGTHVTGTIAAMRAKQGGVVGVIPAGSSIYGMDVLPSNGTGSMSVVIQGLVGCEAQIKAKIKQGKRAKAVVNMSFGAASKSNALEKVLARLASRGDMLFMAASGNDQVSDPGKPRYPASFDTTMSVGAVDCNELPAPFSQQNSEVDIAGPGVDILSTISPEKLIEPLLTTVIKKKKTRYDTTTLTGSGSGVVKGPLVDCQSGFKVCPNAKGKICLIARGKNTFACKTRNAQLGGCVGVVIYNNERPLCKELTAATLIEPTCTHVGKAFPPVVAINQADGLKLKAALKGKGGVNATVAVVKTKKTELYKEESGTSMATPHVTGVASRLWGAFPNCTADDLRDALQVGATDIAPAGRDKVTGYGVVNLRRSYAVLASRPCGGAPPSVSPSPPPPPAPAPLPSPVPAPSPEISPEPAASPSPSLPPPELSSPDPTASPQSIGTAAVS